MKPVILFREGLADKGELVSARKYFDVYESRCQIPENSLVISRYSCLPYYEELEKDLQYRNCKLINSYKQHCFMAEDILFWANEVLMGLTPPAYDRWGHLPEGSYVVKGKTNSRKHHWKTHMFAETKADIQKVVKNLLNDSLINDQGIIVRPYIPLKKYEEGMNGLPITNEWRVFCFKEKIITYGYYWSIIDQPSKIPSELDDNGMELVKKAVKLVSQYVDFFVLDVAQKQDGDWIIIEINDAQMAGLSEINPDDFYKKLQELIK